MLNEDYEALKKVKNGFLAGAKKYFSFIYTDIHIVHKQIFSISMVLKFYEGIRDNLEGGGISKVIP